MANRKTPPNALDLKDMEFGKLTAIERAGRTKNGSALWLCKCECGNTTKANATSLRRGETVSCGCDKRKQIDNARKVLMTEKMVDGVQVPLLTKKVRSDSQTGIKGVRKRVRKGKTYYEANITVKGKRYTSKSYTRIEDAIAWRKAMEEKHHKPYIRQEEIKQWIINNLVTEDEARLITGLTKSGFYAAYKRNRIVPFVSFPHGNRLIRFYLREDLEKYLPRVNNLTGQKFERLKVIEFSGKNSYGETTWLCECDCGNVKPFSGQSLTRGKTKSCGCLKKEYATAAGKSKGKYVARKAYEKDPLLALRRKVRSDNTSGVKGVYFNKKLAKWVATIKAHGKQVYLGSFEKFENAVKARKDAENKILGEKQ